MKIKQKLLFIFFGFVAGMGVMYGINSTQEQVVFEGGVRMADEEASTTHFQNYIVHESAEELSFHDRDGNEIFIIEKE